MVRTQNRKSPILQSLPYPFMILLAFSRWRRAHAISLPQSPAYPDLSWSRTDTEDKSQHKPASPSSTHQKYASPLLETNIHNKDRNINETTQTNSPISSLNIRNRGMTRDMIFRIKEFLLFKFLDRPVDDCSVFCVDHSYYFLAAGFEEDVQDC